MVTAGAIALIVSNWIAYPLVGFLLWAQDWRHNLFRYPWVIVSFLLLIPFSSTLYHICFSEIECLRKSFDEFLITDAMCALFGLVVVMTLFVPFYWRNLAIVVDFSILLIILIMTSAWEWGMFAFSVAHLPLQLFFIWDCFGYWPFYIEILEAVALFFGIASVVLKYYQEDVSYDWFHSGWHLCSGLSSLVYVQLFIYIHSEHFKGVVEQYKRRTRKFYLKNPRRTSLDFETLYTRHEMNRKLREEESD